MIGYALGAALALALLISRAGMWSDVARPVRTLAGRRRARRGARRTAARGEFTRGGRWVPEAPDAIDLEFWGITGGPGEQS